MTNFYKIGPDLNDDSVAYIDDWEFTYWPNKPKSEIIELPDGTFTYRIEENFIPLVTQLKNLFRDGNSPENGTYLGEAVLKGRNQPTDCIYGNFINSTQGLVVSNRLLEIFKKFTLPDYSTYDLPLIKKRKKFDDYSYVYFKQAVDNPSYDVRLIKDTIRPTICVSERLMKAICNAEIVGCEFTLINEST